ncbi:AB hydrolase-1 domain-containing protein [Haematococcus lacustris]|uniref:AB hydrolase-1 domain-containing protein n=1 Tax=Haematococcus lacustris TaxID=44745 RepID=A0A699YYZ1_HAELA|nr:AB hydrolase-1 domain-containing protein [Haematococcus lacustris]
MLADKPSLGSGVGLTVALAPVVYVKYIQSQVMVAFCIQSNTSLLYRSLPSQEFLFMAGPTQALFLNGVCQVPITTPTCVLYNEPRPRFMRFNYGPEYNLRAIKNPFFLVSGGVDVLSAPRDIALTRSMLQQASALVGTHHIADYSHM